MKLFVKMRNLTVAEREKIALGIVSKPELEMQFVAETTRSDIREAILTAAEWRRLLESISSTRLDLRSRHDGSLYIYGPGAPEPNIEKREDGTVRVYGGIPEEKIDILLDLFPEATYTLYEEEPKEISTPKKVEIVKEPEKTDIEIAAEKITKYRKEITESEAAVAVAKEHDLKKQVALHEERIEHFQKRIEFVNRKKVRYPDDYRHISIENYQEIIPASVLDVYHSNVEAGTFDSVDVWEEDNDPLLVGVVENSYSNIYIELAGW